MDDIRDDELPRFYAPHIVHWNRERIANRPTIGERAFSYRTWALNAEHGSMEQVAQEAYLDGAADALFQLRRSVALPAEVDMIVQKLEDELAQARSEFRKLRGPDGFPAD